MQAAVFFYPSWTSNWFIVYVWFFDSLHVQDNYDLNLKLLVDWVDDIFLRILCCIILNCSLGAVNNHLKEQPGMQAGLNALSLTSDLKMPGDLILKA